MHSNLDQSQVQKLLAIGQQLNRSESFEQYLQEIADAAADFTHSEGSSILLFEKETQKLYFAAARAENRENLMKIRVPIDKSVAGWVYDQGSPLNIPNAKIDPLIFRTVEQDLETPTHNLLAIPIIYKDETLGTLEVINKFERQEYTPEDQSVLDILASFAATTIQMHYQSLKSEALDREREELEKQKSNFIAITSHELRTPLGLVLGHATFLNEIIKDDFHQQQLKVIVENAERLKEIINSLSQSSSFESGTARIRWKKTDLNVLVKDVVDSYQVEALEREINLQATISENPVYVFCDAAKLSVAIGNLVHNGLVFSDKGQNVRVNLHKLPGHVHISVVDSGIGIPAEALQLIFERFYQVQTHLTRARGGMGLGLSVSKAIVESHGGYIWVESTLGEGSTFTILLPTEEQSQ
jgi:two-component system phosphate regulon sensor histidine kinase PhoR